jgi:DNA-directed RNA polymerase subunit RPC12/RpoP
LETMRKRECSECGGELVLAVRGNQLQAGQVPGLITSAITSWRCGTCGAAFSAAQLRVDKRERTKVADRV